MYSKKAHSVSAIGFTSFGPDKRSIIQAHHEFDYSVSQDRVIGCSPFPWEMTPKGKYYVDSQCKGYYLSIQKKKRILLI